MEKKKLSRYTIVAGLISIAVFVMFSMPEFNEQGAIILTFNRMGATGMLVAMLVGLFTGCIFNLYSKLHILENNVTIPDFVTEWINNMIHIPVSYTNIQRCESPIHSLPYSRQVCLLFPDGIFAHGY